MTTTATGMPTLGAAEVLDLYRGIICDSLLTEIPKEDTSMGTIKRSTHCSYEAEAGISISADVPSCL